MLWLVVFSSCCVLALMFNRTVLLKKRYLSQQQQGMAQIRHIFALMTLIQQHRFQLVIADKQAISSLSPSLTQQYRLCQQIATLQHNARWQAFEDHWSRLSRKPLQCSENLIEQYHHLLDNLLQLGKELAKKHKLQPAYLSQCPQCLFIWHALPKLIEQHAQLQIRALLFYRQYYNLNYQRQKLQQQLGELRQFSLITLSQLQPFLSPQHKLLTGMIAQNTAHLLTRIKTELLNDNRQLLCEPQLKQLSQHNLDKLNNLLNQQLTLVSNQLDNTSSPE